jgi:hypothetical protein
MATLKTLNIKIFINKLSIQQVTHTVTTDAQFDGYEFSKTGHGAELSGQTGHGCEISGLRD